MDKKRVKLVNVVAGAMNAFPVMEGHGPAYGIYQADYERLMAFLAQCDVDQKQSEADQRQLATLKAALESCVEVMDHGDGEAYTEALAALGRGTQATTVLGLPTPDPKAGAYFFENGCVIQPAYGVPNKFRAFWPNGVPLRGDNDEVSYFDSPEEVLAIFVDAGY